MRSKFLHACLALFVSTPLLAQEVRNLVTVNIRIPYGQSIWSYQLPTAQNISPFRIVYVPTVSCSQFAVRPRVRYQGATNLDETVFQNNLFYSENKAVDTVEINFTQNRFQFQDCQISLQSLAPQTGTPSQKVYAGLLEHSGGFVQRKSVALTSSFYTQEIELVIPDYCEGYEVAELGVNTNPYVKAEQLRSRSLNFRFPKPTQIAQIEVSLLAPTGQACQIPIYVRPLNRP